MFRPLKPSPCLKIQFAASVATLAVSRKALENTAIVESCPGLRC